jgi:hypothetical protein
VGIQLGFPNIGLIPMGLEFLYVLVQVPQPQLALVAQEGVAK